MRGCEAGDSWVTHCGMLTVLTRIPLNLTYRWKGENIATAEVEAAIGTVLGLRDVTVYGVEASFVPACEWVMGILTHFNAMIIALLAQ